MLLDEGRGETMKTLKITGRPVFLLCFFALGFNLYAESAYTIDRVESAFTLDLRRDIIISGLAAGVFFGSFLIPGTEEIPNLDRNDVNFIDRRLMFDNYGSLTVFTNIMRPVMGIMPIIVPLALVQWNVFNFIDDFPVWLTYGVMYIQAVALTYGTRRALGNAIDRHRPFRYFADYIEEPVSPHSFPSGSTAMAFLPATFFSVTFSREFPNSPWRIPVIVGSHLLAAGVGVSRITPGYHFLTDVLAGAAIGSFFGWAIPTLHRRPAVAIGPNAEKKLSFRFAGNGAIMSLRR